MSIVVKLDTRRLDTLLSAIGPRAQAHIGRTSYNVQAGAQMRAPVDTGALKNSLHVEHMARLLNRVADGVEYGIYQEFGTHKMAAQPFLIPAIEAERDNWVQGWMRLLR